MAVVDASTADLITRKDWDGLANKLCSLSYVQLMADTGKIFDLITEFDVAETAIPLRHPASGILPVIGAALRRNATFISRHPAGTFQSFWNLCWWHDCPDRRAFAVALSDQPAMSPQATDEAGPVSRLMESWLHERVETGAGYNWVRSLLPPRTSLTERLRLEIPIGADACRPKALRVSGELIIVWFQEDGEQIRPRVWNLQTGESIPNIDSEELPFADQSLSPDRMLRVSYGGGEQGGWGKPVAVSNTETGDFVASFPLTLATMLVMRHFPRTDSLSPQAVIAMSTEGSSMYGIYGRKRSVRWYS